MICYIYGDTMYLVKVTPNQTHQVKIDSLREPSDPGMFFINSTIQPLCTNTSLKIHVTNIVFVHHSHNPATTTFSLPPL